MERFLHASTATASATSRAVALVLQILVAKHPPPPPPALPQALLPTPALPSEEHILLPPSRYGRPEARYVLSPPTLSMLSAC